MVRRIALLSLGAVLLLAFTGCRFGFLVDLRKKKARDDYPTAVFYGTNGYLHRMDPDGSNHKILISSLDHAPVGLAVNRRTGILYWADHSLASYRVYSASTDGSGLAVVLRSNIGPVMGIDVDQASGTIYLADHNNNRILKVPAGTVNGNGDDFLFNIDGDVTSPWDVAVDSAGGYLYVAQGDTEDRLCRVPLAGGSKYTLVIAENDIFSLELDVANNALYWSDCGIYGSKDPGDKLYRTSMTNPDLTAANSELPISDLEDPCSLALYPGSGYLYWVSGKHTTGTLCRGWTYKLSGDVSGFEFAAITGVSSVVVDCYTGG